MTKEDGILQAKLFIGSPKSKRKDDENKLNFLHFPISCGLLRPWATLFLSHLQQSCRA
jgi:hypothetical protein